MLHRRVNIYVFPFLFSSLFSFTLVLLHTHRFTSPSFSALWKRPKKNCDSLSKTKANSNTKMKNSFTQKHNALHAIAWKSNLIRINTHCVCVCVIEGERERAVERRNSERKISARKCYGFENWTFDLDVCLLSMYGYEYIISMPIKRYLFCFFFLFILN